jgi:hypothetical protein
MATIGEKRKCPTCNESEKVMELIPNPGRDGWYTQKLSCGHTGSIRIMDPIEEKIEIKDEVKSVPIDHKYGQIYTDKTARDSRSILCKCGHRGNQHKFLSDYTGNHNCYLCKCADYRPE